MADGGLVFLVLAPHHDPQFSYYDIFLLLVVVVRLSPSIFGTRQHKLLCISEQPPAFLS
jgi:hypothetical protein